MKELVAGVVLFLEVVNSIFTGEKSVPTNYAQRVYEINYEMEFEEDFMESLEDINNELPYVMDCNYEITWIDNDTCIREIQIFINDDVVGIDSIIDIDKYGDVDEEIDFRWFINDESFADNYTWSDILDSMYPEINNY